MRSFLGRDILSLKDFERQEFFRVFEVAKKLEPIARNRKNSDILKEKTLVTAFYQPSTRTRLAHEAGMIRLGGQVTGFSDAKMTRAGDFYQESIKDTVKMLEFYGLSQNLNLINLEIILPDTFTILSVMNGFFLYWVFNVISRAAMFFFMS